MCYSHPHPLTYQPNPTYMAKPTYLVGTLIDLPNGRKQSRKNKMKVLHETLSCSFNKINKGKIKIIVTPLCKGIANKHQL